MSVLIIQAVIQMNGVLHQDHPTSVLTCWNHVASWIARLLFLAECVETKDLVLVKPVFNKAERSSDPFCSQHSCKLFGQLCARSVLSSAFTQCLPQHNPGPYLPSPMLVPDSVQS